MTPENHLDPELVLKKMLILEQFLNMEPDMDKVAPNTYHRRDYACEYLEFSTPDQRTTVRLTRLHNPNEMQSSVYLLDISRASHNDDGKITTVSITFPVGDERQYKFYSIGVQIGARNEMQEGTLTNSSPINCISDNPETVHFRVSPKFKKELDRLGIPYKNFRGGQIELDLTFEGISNIINTVLTAL